MDKRVEEGNKVSEKKIRKILVQQDSTNSSQYDRQDAQRAEMCDIHNFDVSFGTQFTSFVCTKECHQLSLIYFRKQEIGLILRWYIQLMENCEGS